MTRLETYQVEPGLVKGKSSIFGKTCPRCGGSLRQAVFDIPRHQAGEWLKAGILSGEAEAAFASTRDDLGWKVRAWVCGSCQKLAPLALEHPRK
jgi:ribosomal protein S27AE